MEGDVAFVGAISRAILLCVCPQPSHPPTTFRRAVEAAELPSEVENTLIEHYGDPYALETRLQELPSMTPGIRERVVRLLVAESGGSVLDIES